MTVASRGSPRTTAATHEIEQPIADSLRQEAVRAGTTVAAGFDGMVTACLSFRVLPHKRAEVLSAMEVFVERMRNSAGCTRSRLLADVEDLNALTLLSEWRDAEASRTFFDSREFQIFRGIRILLRDEPLLQFDDVQARVMRLLQSS